MRADGPEHDLTRDGAPCARRHRRTRAQSALIDDAIGAGRSHAGCGRRPFETEQIELTAPIVGRAGNHSVQAIGVVGYADGGSIADDGTRRPSGRVRDRRVATCPRCRCHGGRRGGGAEPDRRAVARAQGCGDRPPRRRRSVDRLARDADVLGPEGRRRPGDRGARSQRLRTCGAARVALVGAALREGRSDALTDRPRTRPPLRPVRRVLR